VAYLPHDELSGNMFIYSKKSNFPPLAIKKSDFQPATTKPDKERYEVDTTSFLKM
jgi:hypothetical protein